MNPLIFRQYDIRGIVGRDLDDEVVGRVARAFGTLLLRRGRTASVVIGCDVRPSSEGFRARLAEGLAACGIEVLDAGVVPTPLVYFGIIHEEAGGGVAITGSHNPPEYNGIKMCDGPLAIWGEQIQEVRRLAESGDFERGEGSIRRIDLFEPWLDDLSTRFSFQRGHEIVVDCGNGVGGMFVPRILAHFGMNVDELYCEPDGTFPNHIPDPEVPEYVRDLIRRVKESGAEVGFGFDGDADRLGLIDETGRKISADWLLAVFARDLLERHPGGIVRFDVKCTDFLEEDVRAHGGVPMMGPTGHSLLKRDMKETGAIIGGELSGHIVFGREYHMIDDPVYCALKVLQLMEKHDCSCSALFEGFPETFTTPEIKLPIAEERKFEIVAELTREFAADHEVITIDGARVVFSDGWGLVRASNTTANLTVRFEARSAEALRRIQAEFLDRFRSHPEIDVTPLESV